MRELGLTPQHYQLLLAWKGFPGRECSIRELAKVFSCAITAWWSWSTARRLKGWSRAQRTPTTLGCSGLC